MSRTDRQPLPQYLKSVGITASISTIRSIIGKSAAEIRAVWDYRPLKIDQAREILSTISWYRRADREPRKKRGAWERSAGGRILTLQCERNAARQQWADKKTITIPDSLCRTYTAAWNAGHTYIAISDTIRAVVAWDEDSDWHYYSKSYGRPKNTYFNRRVNFIRFNPHTCKTETLYTHHVDSFRGDFLRTAYQAYASKTGDTTPIEAITAYDQAVETEAKQTKPAYKIVRKKTDTEFSSIYAPESYIYKIGETVTEKARPNHGGGLYVWATLAEARLQMGNRDICCDGDTIIECAVRGKTLTYGNGKIAVSELTPVAVAYQQ